MNLGLCQALCKISTTTGHFAQFLKIKRSNEQRFLAKRRRSAWLEWLRAVNFCAPIGSSNWRLQNKHFQSDAVGLLAHLHDKQEVPAVIYADPPYTKDQYSRYYHLYETLLLYDYPESLGMGRCRPDKFVSRFSRPSQAFAAIAELIAAAARLGSVLIITYPDRGLIGDSMNQISSLLRRYFRRSEIVCSLKMLHSSLGASKGKEKYVAREVVYLAR